MLAAFALAAIVPWLPVPPEAMLPTALVARDATQWPLAPGQARRHVVALESGQFVRVTVKQAGIDVTVRLYDPDGTAHDLVDANEGPRGWEPASLLASTSGTHVIEVAAAPTAPEAGHYVVDADPAHQVEPRDRRRLIAEAARAKAGPGLGPRAVYAKRSLTAIATQESIRQLPLAAGIFHALGETCWEADSLTFLGLVRGWAYEGVEYLELHQRALALWERCGDRYRQAEAHNYAAEGFANAGQYTRAVETCERGLALAREEGARDIELLLLNKAGGIYNVLGETDKALAYVEEALADFHARDLGLLEEIALRNLSLVHFRRGELQRAAERALEAMASARRVDDRIGQKLVAGTLGEIYLALGEPAEARRSMTDALLGSEYASQPWTLPFFPVLVRAYEATGDAQGALAVLDPALRHSQLTGYRQFEVSSLLTVARIQLRYGDPEVAREAAYQASEMLHGSGDRFEIAGALELLGNATAELNGWPSAGQAFEESLEIRRNIGDGQGAAMSLHGLARVDRTRGDPQSARVRLEEALPLIEAARTRIVSPELRSTWLGHVRSIHEAHVDTLMELHRRDPRAGWDVKAFEASESLRARSLLDLLAESRAGFRQGADPDLLDRERVLREKLGARLEMQLRLPAESSPGRRDELAHEIQVLSADYEDVRGRVRTSSPRYAALAQPEPLGLDRVRGELLDPDTLLLQYSLGDARSYLWVVGQDRFEAYELAGQSAIESEVRRAHTLVSRRPGREADRNPLAALSALLLGPVRERLADERLLFVADGPLHHVPFGALPDERGRPLVARHEIVNAPSASVVASLRATAGLRPRPSRTIAVLADPVFDRADTRVDSSARLPAAGDPAGEHATLDLATRDFGFEGGRLPRLPFTRREARSILALAPGSRLALDFQASRATVQDPQLKEYRYLHFATHGLLNDERPELSGLVLSLVDRDGRDVPGLLTAPDVFNLELGADLVVLSGCRTALGKEIRGEGLIGLTRAFMYAGVPRVVASLWPVDDLTTAELMKAFYEGMLGPQRLRPAAALRRAQARMARDPRWSAPYYWAGFQLQGDWR